MTGVRRPCEDTHRGKGHVMMDAETGNDVATSPGMAEATGPGEAREDSGSFQRE